jgi:hypothetical protein
MQPEETHEPSQYSQPPQPSEALEALEPLEASEASEASGPGPEAASTHETLATGDAAVDEVLASVAALDDRPVDEHVAVFEQAHDRLRRALDARPDS